MNIASRQTYIYKSTSVKDIIWYLKECPRCNGDLYNDPNGISTGKTRVKCLQCGFSAELNTLKIK